MEDNIVEMVVLPKTIYGFLFIPVKIPTAFCKDNKAEHFIHTKFQRT